MLAGQPTIDQVLPAFHHFCEDTVLVGHNAAFDLRFLQLKEAATGIRFNQPVRAADIAAHITARFEQHPWELPVLPPEGLARLEAVDPTSVQRFNAKVAATSAVARSTSPVALQLASSWDKKQFPPSRDLVVFETTTAVAPEAWVRIGVLPTIPSPAGVETPAAESSYVIKVERAFFVEGFHCTRACPADVGNRVAVRVPVKAAVFASAVQAAELTASGQFVPVAKASTPRPRQKAAAH